MSRKIDKKRFELSGFELRKMGQSESYGTDSPAHDKIPWYSHLQLYVMLGFILSFIAWSAFAKLDEVARGEGKVIPASEVQLVQSLEGGIIEELLVAEGETVTSGQPLVRIRNVQAKSDFSALQQRYMGLQAAIARLQAEAQGTELIFPDDVARGAPDSVKAEMAAFHADRREYEGQAEILGEQQRQKDQEAQEISSRIADMKKVFDLSRKTYDMVKPMVEKGASSKMELLQLEKQIAEQETELNSLKLTQPRIEAAIDEVRKRKEQLHKSIAAEAQKQLAEKTTELNTLKETILGYQDKSDRAEIRSPATGTVKDIKIKTLGGVARPGESIMEIVPSEDELLVECNIRPADIAFIYPGQKAIVRLTAFDFGIFGSFEGRVVDISADTMVNEHRESFYRVKIKPDKTNIEQDGKQYVLIPGMQASVDIVTGTKTVMTYLLKPFIKASQMALSER